MRVCFCLGCSEKSRLKGFTGNLPQGEVEYGSMELWMMPLVQNLFPVCGPPYLSVSCSVDSLQPRGLQRARLLCPWDSPGKNTAVGCHALLQRIFLTQESNPGSPALQADSLPSQPPRKPQYLRGTSNCDILIISDLKYVLLCLPPK